ncbi:uncharacterized protein LOC101450841 isoform X1 [Ceratitis capitata]|uniref:uncharacterized protein LOC101450841 isoform X1 n=1 Tax=Ceratitis capitata TaxID=7213 RepID=UPI00032A1FD4|nr:uncharacterized protein LOC101450841 isoform X1 [Ceratitis capitata]
MLARIFQRGLSGAQQNCLGLFSNRKPSNEYSPHLPGGGLEKLAGCFKEENYFKLNDWKLLLKMREQTLRGAGYDTTEMNHVIEQLNEMDHLVTHHNQSLMNKHKNCMEELYFLNEVRLEETMNLRRLEKKMHAELEQKLREQQKLESTRRAAEQLANTMETLPTMRNIRYEQ